LLAKYWTAWNHFLGVADVLTQCALVSAPVILTEAIVALALAIVLCFLIERGWLRETATETCGDLLTLLVIGFSAAQVLGGSRWLASVHPTLLIAIGIAILAAVRLRSDEPRLRFEQYNRTSEVILPGFVVVLAILLPGRVKLRRFDAIPADSPPVQSAQKKPDVIVITFDALSAEDVSLLHHSLPTTPNLERLAQTSHVFTHFYSSSDFTTPAVVSLMTGKDLLAHRVYQLTGMLAPTIRSQNLAQVLADAGYKTIGVVTNSYAHPLHLGIDASFDYLPEPPTNPWLSPVNWPLQIGHTLLFDSDASPTSWVVPMLRAWGRYLPSFNQSPNVDPYQVFALSERLMDSVAGPKFIWIHLFSPHFPYVTRPQSQGRFLAGNQFLTQADFEAIRRVGHYRGAAQPLCDELRARYDEAIAESDAALGAFLNWLNESARRTHTILVVSADHGESFHQWWGHQSPFLLYPEVHIPLLISLPGQKDSIWHDEDGGLADVAPTVLDRLGIKPPRWMTGHALLAQGPAQNSREPAFAAYLARSYTFGAPRVGTLCAFSGDYQLVWFFPLGVRRLFDIRRDPRGTLDVIGEHPDIAARLSGALKQRFGADIPALKDE
jgi:arylsulfatase A-like enzyme